eukprot:1909591-Amphidinium_carterae.1
MSAQMMVVRNQPRVSDEALMDLSCVCFDEGTSKCVRRSVFECRAPHKLDTICTETLVRKPEATPQLKNRSDFAIWYGTGSL